VHESVLRFTMQNLFDHEVRDKRVLEVGSMNVNGSVRPFVESLKPASYEGIDIAAGPGVDRVYDVSHGLKLMAYDLVISTEMLEHAEHWETSFRAMFDGARETVLLTARGPGFQYHNPPDYWRFRPDDLLRVVPKGWRVAQCIQDPQVPGVFLKAVRIGASVGVEKAKIL